MSSLCMAGSSRRYAREAWLAAKGTVGGGLSAVELARIQPKCGVAQKGTSHANIDFSRTRSINHDSSYYATVITHHVTLHSGANYFNSKPPSSTHRLLNIQTIHYFFDSEPIHSGRYPQVYS